MEQRDSNKPTNIALQSLWAQIEQDMHHCGLASWVSLLREPAGLSSEATEPLLLAFTPSDVLMKKNKTLMTSTPPKLLTFSDGISPNSTMHKFNMQRENRAPFSSVCESTEGLGLSLGGRQSYSGWKDSAVHHLYSPQAFITLPTSSEVRECCGLNFTEVGASARSPWDDFSYQQRVEKKMVFTSSWAFKGKLILQKSTA